VNLDRFYRQTLTYWGAPVTDGYGGWTFATPVEIQGRWEDKQELFINAKGEQALSRARVFVDQAVVNGGYLYSGTSSATNPQLVDGAHRIEGFKGTPSMAANATLRVVWL